MPFSIRHWPPGFASEDRVFADDAGRLWSAARSRQGPEWAVVFACITDARQPIRALALGDEARGTADTETQLQEWLAVAPRIGALS